MILLSILSVIRHMICGNSLNWLLNLWLVDFNTGKTQLVSFDRSNKSGSIDVKMDGAVVEEKSCFKMLELTFASKLDWGSYIISIAKTASQKIGALIRSMKFLKIYKSIIYKSTIRPCILLSHLGWCPQLLLGIIRKATRTKMQDCWSFICCLS